MKLIYKYNIDIRDEQTIELPKNSILLSAQQQEYGSISLWALVDNEEPKVEKKIYLIGTGHPIEDIEGKFYVSTVLINPYVWHVFQGVD